MIPNKPNGLLEALASLRLTLLCLGLTMTLVFFGTLAQVNIGTFAAQKEYFNRLLIYGHVHGFRVPIFPGGLSIGVLWLVNLVAAFFTQFRLLRKNSGILISHAGVMLLLLGQFLTQTLAKESQLALEIGQSGNHSESPREPELVVTMISDPLFNDETTIPLSKFNRPGPIETDRLPFTINVKRVYPNSRLSMTSGAPSLATEGIGTRVSIEEAPPVSSDEAVNNVSIFIEVTDGGKNLGTWLVSTALGAPQSFVAGGKEYSLAIRPKRSYFPFTLRLTDFRHDIYPGTDIPKNFASTVHLSNPATKEERDVLIYMNNPLRYDGKTFYQASFGKNDTLSIFQVVENPAWITPYVACALVIFGLAVQFLMHLFGFIRSRP